MPQRLSRSVEQASRTDVARRRSHPIVEVRRGTRGQRSTCDDVPGVSGHFRERGQALLLLDTAQVRARQDEPILLTGGTFVDGEALARGTGDRNPAVPHALPVQQRAQDRAGGRSDREHRDDRFAQNPHDAGDVDAPAAGVVARFAAADLVGGPHPFGSRGDVHCRIHGECDDRRHRKAPPRTRTVGARILPSDREWPAEPRTGPKGPSHAGTDLNQWTGGVS